MFNGSHIELALRFSIQIIYTLCSYIRITLTHRRWILSSDIYFSFFLVRLFPFERKNIIWFDKYKTSICFDASSSITLCSWSSQVTSTINGTHKFLGTSPADERTNCALVSSKQLSAILIFGGRDIPKRSDRLYIWSDTFSSFFLGGGFPLSFLITLRDEREEETLNRCQNYG